MEPEYDLLIDANQMCRICLTENTNMKQIFCNEIINGEIRFFPKVLQSITNYRICKDDGFPQKLCTTCRTTVTNAYILKEKCTKNHDLLCKILKLKLPANFVDVECQTDMECDIDGDDSGRLKGMQKEIIEITMISFGTQTEELITGKSIGIQTVQLNNNCVHTQTNKHRMNSIMCQTDDRMNSIMCQTDDLVNTIKITVDTQTIDFGKIDLSQKPLISPKALSLEENNSADHESEVIDIESNFLNNIDDNDDNDDDNDEDDDDDDDDDDSNGNDYVNDDYKDVDDKEIETSPPPVEMQIENMEMCDDDDGEQADDGDENLTVEYLVNIDEILDEEYNTTDPTTLQNTESCNLCNLTLNTDDGSYEAHANFHRDIMPSLFKSIVYFRCGHCFTLYLNPIDLGNHYLNSVTCRKKDQIASSLPSYTDYQFLDDSITKSDENNEHLFGQICSVIYSDTNLPYSCEYCTEQTESETINDLYDHFSLKHQFTPLTESNDANNRMKKILFRNNINHKCGMCNDKEYFKINDAISHIYFHSNNFDCLYENCESRYFRFPFFIQHLMKKHFNYKTCQRCQSFQFNEKKEFQKHLSLCTAKYTKTIKQESIIIKKQRRNGQAQVMKKKFICVYCEKQFRQSGDLKSHVRIHTNEKPYKCPKCDKSFRTYGNRKDHVETHEVDKQFHCTECGMVFKTQRTLRGHVALHLNEKKFPCQLCTKSFRRKYHLKCHIKKLHPNTVET